MNLGRVVGTVVATQKEDRLRGFKLSTLSQSAIASEYSVLRSDSSNDSFA